MKLFGRWFRKSSNNQLNINDLREKIGLVNSFWEEIRNKLMVNGEYEPAYLWDDNVKRYLRHIQSECKLIRGCYQTNKRRYIKQFENIKKIINHIKRIKYSKEWIITLGGYLEKMQDDLESIMTENETIQAASPELISRRTFFKSAAIASAAVSPVIALGTLKVLEAYLKKEAAKLPTNDKDGLAILISRPRDIDEVLGSYFKGIYTSRMQFAFGFKARHIVINANGNDLKRMLYDQSVQNICVLGHGSNEGWQAQASGDVVQTLVSFDLLKQWYEEHPAHKNGYFVKHTCGHEITESGTMTFVKPEVFRRFEAERLRFQEYVDSELRHYPEKEKARHTQILKANIRKASDQYEINKWLSNLQSIEQMSVDEYKQKWLRGLPEKIYVLWAKKFGSDSLGYELGDLVLRRSEDSRDDPSSFFVPYGVNLTLQELKARIRIALNNTNNQIQCPRLLGIPFFDPENIMAWTRVTYIQDFLVNPFANTQITFDRYSARAMKLYEFLTGGKHRF